MSTDRGELTFTSTTAPDPEHRRLVISEQHALIAGGNERVVDYQFAMQCGTASELQSALAQCGFGSVAYFGAYDGSVRAGATDRLVVVAQRLDVAA